MNTFNKLKEAREAYLNNNQIMSDQEYDNLLRNYLASEECTEEERIFLLRNYEYDSAPLTENPVEESNFSIVSVMSESDLDAFLSKYSKSDKFVVSCKIDGIRGNITYRKDQNGIYKLESVKSRSYNNMFNRIVSDILPQKFRVNGLNLETVTITVEYYVNENNMEEIKFLKRQSYASCLNAANSIARTGMPFGRIDLLSYAVHRVFIPNLDFVTRMQIAKALSFNIVPCREVTKEDVKKEAEKLFYSSKGKGIPTDGIVISAVSDDASLTNTNGKIAFENEIAYKPSEWVTSTYLSKVIDILFEPVGQRYNSKLKIAPILTREGKYAREVNAHTPSEIIDNNIRVGDTVEFKVQSNNYIELVRKVVS